MCGFMILFHIFTTQTVEEELINLLSKPDEFADFTFLGFLTTQNGNVVAITVFLGWIKIFKYLTFNKTMTQLTKTLSRVIHIDFFKKSRIKDFQLLIFPFGFFCHLFLDGAKNSKQDTCNEISVIFIFLFF